MKLPFPSKKSGVFFRSSYQQDRSLINPFETRIKAELTKPRQLSQTRTSGRDRGCTDPPPEHAHAVAFTCIFVWGGPLCWRTCWLCGCGFAAASRLPILFIHVRLFCFALCLAALLRGVDTFVSLSLFRKTWISGCTYFLKNHEKPLTQ